MSARISVHMAEAEKMSRYSVRAVATTLLPITIYKYKREILLVRSDRPHTVWCMSNDNAETEQIVYSAEASSAVAAVENDVNIVISKLLKRHSKAKRKHQLIHERSDESERFPKGIVYGKLRSDFKRVR